MILYAMYICHMNKNMDTLSHQGSGGDGSRDVPVRYERAIEH